MYDVFELLLPIVIAAAFVGVIVVVATDSRGEAGSSAKDEEKEQNGVYAGCAADVSADRNLYAGSRLQKMQIAVKLVTVAAMIISFVWLQINCKKVSIAEFFSHTAEFLVSILFYAIYNVAVRHAYIVKAYTKHLGCDVSAKTTAVRYRAVGWVQKAPVFLFITGTVYVMCFGLSGVGFFRDLTGSLFYLSFIPFVGMSIALRVCAMRADKTVLRVLAEVYAGEGRAAEKQLFATLKKCAKAKDEDGFMQALFEAHARYAARENLILPQADAAKVTRKTVTMATILEGKEKGKAVRAQGKAWYASRDFENLSAAYTAYTEQLEEYKIKRLEETKAQNASSYALENNGESTFDGTIWQRIGWEWLCRFVTAITLGIAYPATLCWKQRWVCKHTLYNGKRLSFDGTGLQLFGKWICWVLLTLLTCGIYGFFVAKRVEQWKAKHTHIAGECAQLGGTFDGNAFVMVLRKVGGFLLKVVTLGLGIPYVICMQERWLCKHRVYDGRRLVFSGHATALFGKFIIWWLLMIVTLGIYALVVPNRMLKWKAQNTTLCEEQEVVL